MVVQIPYSPWGDGNLVFSWFIPLSIVQIPFSPWGDGNLHSCSLSLSSQASDTLIPKRLQKQKLNQLVMVLYLRSDTLIPVRGRKHQVLIQYSWRCCSDTLLPARGRKRCLSAYLHFSANLVQIPFSPWGDENLCALPIKLWFSKFRCPTPREGTETCQHETKWKD